MAYSLLDVGGVISVTAGCLPPPPQPRVFIPSCHTIHITGYERLDLSASSSFRFYVESHTSVKGSFSLTSDGGLKDEGCSVNG